MPVRGCLSLGRFVGVAAAEPLFSLAVRSIFDEEIAFFIAKTTIMKKIFALLSFFVIVAAAANAQASAQITKNIDKSSPALSAPVTSPVPSPVNLLPTPPAAKITTTWDLPITTPPQPAPSKSSGKGGSMSSTWDVAKNSVD
jgi:hypothetical protein